MEVISYKEFINKFRPLRNTFDRSSYLNITFDDSTERESEFLEDKKKNNLWSVMDDGTIISGKKNGFHVLGYAVSNTEHDNNTIVTI